MAAKRNAADPPPPAVQQAAPVQRVHAPLSFMQIVCAWLGNRKSNNIPSEDFIPTSCVNGVSQAKNGRKAPTLRANVLTYRSFVRLHIDTGATASSGSSGESNRNRDHQIGVALRMEIEKVFKMQFEPGSKAQEIRALGHQQLMRAKRRSISEHSTLVRTCLELLRAVDPAPFPAIPAEHKPVQEPTGMLQRQGQTLGNPTQQLPKPASAMPVGGNFQLALPGAAAGSNMSHASIHVSRDSNSTISGFADPMRSASLLRAQGDCYGLRAPLVPSTSSRLAQAGNSSEYASYRSGAVQQETRGGLSSFPLATMLGQRAAATYPAHGAAGAIVARGVLAPTSGTLELHTPSSPTIGTSTHVAGQIMLTSGMARASSQARTSGIAPARNGLAPPPAHQQGGMDETSGQQASMLWSTPTEHPMSALARAACAATSNSGGGITTASQQAHSKPAAPRSIDESMTLWRSAHVQWLGRITKSIDHAKMQPVASTNAVASGTSNGCLLHVQLRVPFFRQTAFIPATIMCSVPRTGAQVDNIMALGPGGVQRPVTVESTALLRGLTAAATRAAERTMQDLLQGSGFQLHLNNEPVSYFGVHLRMLTVDLDSYQQQLMVEHARQANIKQQLELRQQSLLGMQRLGMHGLQNLSSELHRPLDFSGCNPRSRASIAVFLRKSPSPTGAVPTVSPSSSSSSSSSPSPSSSQGHWRAERCSEAAMTGSSAALASASASGTHSTSTAQSAGILSLAAAGQTMSKSHALPKTVPLWIAQQAYQTRSDGSNGTARSRARNFLAAAGGWGVAESSTNSSAATLSKHPFAEVKTDGVISPSASSGSMTLSEGLGDPHDVDDAGPRKTTGEAIRRVVGPAVGFKRGRGAFDAGLQRDDHARMLDESRCGHDHTAGTAGPGSTSFGESALSKVPNRIDSSPTTMDGIPDGKRARIDSKSAGVLPSE